MRALLVVDVQPDFLPGGPLGVPDGDAVIPVIRRLAGADPGAGAGAPVADLVVATQDWHPADHGSFAANHPGHAPGEVIDFDGLEQILWPVHCVQGTPGAELAEGIGDLAFDAIVRKGEDPRVDSYSGFHDNGHRRSTGLADWLRERGVDEVLVTGLAADYCVKFTALDAVDEGFTTTLVRDATRGVDLSPGDTERALEELRRKGVRIATSDDVFPAGRAG